MLAVLEHIEPKRLKKVIKDIHGILKPNGILIVTTPASWAENVMKLLAKLRLLSPVEIADHKDIYNHGKIGSILQQAGFERHKLRFGYFELFMNMWVTALK